MAKQSGIMAKIKLWFYPNEEELGASVTLRRESVDVNKAIDWVTTSTDLGAVMLRQSIVLKRVKVFNFTVEFEHAFKAMQAAVVASQQASDERLKKLKEDLKYYEDDDYRSYRSSSYEQRYRLRECIEAETKARRDIDATAERFEQLAAYIPEAIQRDRAAMARALSVDNYLADEIQGDAFVVDITTVSDYTAELLHTFMLACAEIQPKLISSISQQQMASAVELLDDMVRELVRRLRVEKSSATIEADGELEVAMMRAKTFIGV